jgi:hypothetical protein
MSGSIFIFSFFPKHGKATDLYKLGPFDFVHGRSIARADNVQPPWRDTNGRWIWQKSRNAYSGDKASNVIGCLAQPDLTSTCSMSTIQWSFSIRR